MNGNTETETKYIVTAHNGLAHVTSYVHAPGQHAIAACGIDVRVEPCGLSYDAWNVWDYRNPNWGRHGNTHLIRCHRCWTKATGQEETEPPTIRKSRTVAEPATGQEIDERVAEGFKAMADDDAEGSEAVEFSINFPSCEHKHSCCIKVYHSAYGGCEIVEASFNGRPFPFNRRAAPTNCLCHNIRPKRHWVAEAVILTVLVVLLTLAGVCIALKAGWVG